MTGLHYPSPFTSDSSSIPAPPALLFIDSRVQDYEQLLTDIAPNTEAFILHPSEDGVLQSRRHCWAKLKSPVLTLFRTVWRVRCSLAVPGLA
ncbi:MAG: DUF4347 domain-containing protein [Leptolyngbyaceae cyanobacterium SM1_3_5]|nr:DUF4347 domain-containing protein [Leptolyngbyaceae cyanobacterium SM1_3_5]